MRGSPILVGQLFVQTVFGSCKVILRHVDPKLPQARGTDRDQQGFDGLMSMSKIAKAFLDQIFSRFHATILLEKWFIRIKYGHRGPLSFYSNSPIGKRSRRNIEFHRDPPLEFPPCIEKPFVLYPRDQLPDTVKTDR